MQSVEVDDVACFCVRAKADGDGRLIRKSPANQRPPHSSNTDNNPASPSPESLLHQAIHHSPALPHHSALSFSLQNGFRSPNHPLPKGIRHRRRERQGGLRFRVFSGSFRRVDEDWTFGSAVWRARRINRIGIWMREGDTLHEEQIPAGNEV